MQDITQQPTINPPTKPKKPDIITRYKNAVPVTVRWAILLAMLVAGFLIIILTVATGTISSGGPAPTWVLITSGLIVLVASIVVLAYAKSVLKFDMPLLFLAITFNFVIILMKFVVSPLTLYSNVISITTGGFSTDFDPRSPIAIVLTAVGVLFIYVLIYSLFYKVFYKDVKNKLANIANNLPSSPTLDSKKAKVLVSKTLINVVIIAIGIFTGVLPILITVVLLIPLLFLSTSISYLGLVLNNMIVFIVFGIGCGLTLFYYASKTAFAYRNLLFLSSIFYIGLCLILAYHVIWVAYLAILAIVWPFRVVTYSSK